MILEKLNNQRPPLLNTSPAVALLYLLSNTPTHKCALHSQWPTFKPPILAGFQTGDNNFRRQLYHEADLLGKKVLKGTRWLLLKNPENLDGKRQEASRLQEALSLNQPLSIAYYMKEDLRQIWKQPNRIKAKEFLVDWVFRAATSGIGMLKKMAKTIAAHGFGILAYYDHPISTGPLEGTNNKIKTMKRQAYGFRDQEFFKLKIMDCHRAKYALVG